MKILVFDNYDSFTYNLVHLVQSLTDAELTVKRNDKLTLDEVADFDKVLLSPGPGIPEEAGLLLPLIKAYGSSKSILGVCLGHQAIGEAYGAQLYNLPQVFHGVATPGKVMVNDSPLLQGLPSTFEIGRYHSWVVAKEGLPGCFRITMEDEAGYIMAMHHREYDVQGVQFHPESVLTPLGKHIIANWLKN